MVRVRIGRFFAKGGADRKASIWKDSKMDIEVNAQPSMWQPIFTISRSTATYQAKELEKNFEPPPQPSVVVQISPEAMALQNG